VPSLLDRRSPEAPEHRDEAVRHNGPSGGGLFGCCICAQASVRAFELSGYWIRQCTACGHQFVELTKAAHHVEQEFGDEYFTSGGVGYSDYLNEERLLIHRGSRYARLMAKFSRPGAVCEVGAAAGFGLLGFREAGWQTCGIEPNARMAGYGRQRFDLDVQTIKFEDWQPGVRFDLVTLLQVLPHLIDPAAALCKAASLVRPGGHLLIETWDRGSWTARLFGRHWHEYSPPNVLHWFTRAGLRQLAKHAGFEQVATGRPTKWIDAAHAKSLLEHKSRTSLVNRLAWQAIRLIPNRLAIPYLADDLFWSLFRREQVAH